MLRRMKIGGRLNLLIMVPLLALVAAAAVGYLALQRSSVRGDEYKALKMAQDLKADTAPPPANLLEAWANVNQVAVIASADGWTADSHAEIDEHMAVIEAARARFDSAMAYWAGQSLDPRVQARLVEIGGDIGDKFFADIESLEWDNVMAVNVRGTFECVKAVYPVMRDNNYGKIINIASGTVFKGAPNLLHYVTSKGAIIAMTRSLSRELGRYNICVNAIAPGLTMSENVVAGSNYNAEKLDANRSTRALNRYQEPRDLVGAVLFLASGDSDFMTGQTMVVDGGSVMH